MSRFVSAHAILLLSYLGAFLLDVSALLFDVVAGGIFALTIGAWVSIASARQGSAAAQSPRCTAAGSDGSEVSAWGRDGSTLYLVVALVVVASAGHDPARPVRSAVTAVIAGALR